MTLPDRFEDLPEEEQARVRSAGAELVRLAHSFSTTLLIAGYASVSGAKLQSATGLILEGAEGLLLLTAWHVVEGYRERRASETPLFFYVGDAPLSELDVVFEDPRNDIVCVRLPAAVRSKIEAKPYTPLSWPPGRPQESDMVFFAGFPGVFRRNVDDVNLEFSDYAAAVPVTRVREHQFICQFKREDWISFGRAEIPPPGTDLGGISGTPVFLMGRLAFPLVGIISQFSHDFELLYIMTLDHLPAELFRAAT